MKYLFLYFFLFIGFSSFGQKLQTIDSLLYKIKNCEEDSLKVDLLNKIFYKYRSSDLEIAKKYIDTALKLSIIIEYPKGITHSSINKSSVFSATGRNEDAVNTLKKGLSKVTKYRYSKGIVNLNVWLANTYLSQNKLDSAKTCLNMAIIEAKKAKFYKGLSNAYTNYGNYYIVQSDYTNAVKYYIKVDSICTTNNYSGSSCRVALLNIGSIKTTLEEYDDAMFYFNKVEIMLEGKSAQINTTNQVKLFKGIVEFKRENFEEAINYFEEALVYFNKTNRIPKKIEVLNFLGPAYRKTKQYSLSENALIKAAELSKNIDKKLSESDSYIELGLLFFDLKDYDKAISYFKEGKEIANKLSLIATIESASKGLSDAYYYKGHFKSAAKEYKEYIVIQDSLNSLRNKEITLDLETKYQTQKKEKEIVLLKSQNELAEQQKKNQRNILMGGIVLTTLAGLFFFFQYRNRRKINKKLEELDAAKSNFFANISHEFRTPITLISGPIQKQLKKKSISQEERKNLEMMLRNSDRLLSLVNQLLDISKIETGNLKLAISKNYLLPFINTLAEGFAFIAKQKKINYTINSNNTNVDTWFDKDVIEKIVVNLLSNAIKYTPKSGSIVCNTHVENNHLHFKIENTGKGLTEDELKKIFERFYQININEQGAGIGLTLIKELVAVHKGVITVESTPNKWTVFTVVLPIDKESFKENDFSDNTNKIFKEYSIHKETLSNDKIIDASNNSEDYKNSEDHPILLIVEDNADIRKYLNNSFKETYTILQAQDGQEGIDLAIENIPDIIICDIMMPVKNGIELCQQLKNDERTSHIPIILLTAKTGKENEIEGIKTGADDYITKPFNDDLLILKVSKLIENRKKLQQRYSQEIILKPKDITINSTDEFFLKRVQKVLDNNLIESSFSSKEFSSTVGMSRMQLHRKLKALTGLTTSEFIRSQRLKLAAILLKKSDVNVSQICYSVGFNNPGYFSKCFKEMYHCTPSDYVKQNS